MLIALLLAQAAPCPVPAPLPADFAGWTIGGSVAGAAEPTAVAESMLTIGRGVRAGLQPAGALRLPVTPKRPGAHGGLFAFEAASAGRYKVALGARHWVEIVSNGASVPSVAHGHGPECTPVRKIVEFDLRPGRYLLQVTGDTAAVQLEIVKA